MILNRSTYILALFFLFANLGCETDPGDEGWNSNNQINNQSDGGTDSSFRVTKIEPNHGPVKGGNTVTIRGFGFEEGTRIFFGEHWADPGNTVFIAQNRMMVSVPAGMTGYVDVTAQNSDMTKTSLENGYFYDRFTFTPASGSMSGGTYVEISSPENEFKPDYTYYLGDKELLDINYVSDSKLIAKTPPHSPGEVDFEVIKTDASPLITQNAFLYYDTTDPAYGGMNGEEISGSLTVTALNIYGKEPIENAFVMLGTNTSTPFQGRTNSDGQITFASPDLQGQQMVTVAHEEFEIYSVIGFNSSEITLFLNPFDPPSNPTGGIPGVPNEVYSHLTGAVLFQDAEFQYSCYWDLMVPDPVPPGYHRAVKIYQTLGSYSVASPQVYTLTETSSCVDEFGFPFSLTIYPGSFALYALAGYQNEDDNDFIPVSYGIVRNIFAGAGESLSTKIRIDRFLNQTIEVNLDNPPPLDAENGPLEYKVKLITDLGVDGYIIRKDSTKTTVDATSPLVFENQMQIYGELSDATYSIYAEANTEGSYPFSQVFKKNLAGASSFEIDDFLGVPTPISPDGAPPENNRFSFESSVIKPTFSQIKITEFPSGDRFWRILLNGELSSFSLPQLQTIEGVPPLPASQLYWHIQTILVPNLDFNNFTYRYLSQTYWKSNAADGTSFNF
ncbi:MAG: IPT/TIG domain-containing protein [Myxococcota bacterium]